MSRVPLVLFATLMLAMPARAQDAPQPTRIYVAYYQISYGDLEEWIGMYYEQSVPILEALVDEGLIAGFNARMHNTGGEYNIRQGITGNTDTNFDAFWDEYLARLQVADAAAFERSNRMILAHEDEIWNIDVANIPDGADTRYVYDTMFQVNFADLEEWNTIWQELLVPVLDQAMTDGLLAGYVFESHNTGRRFNWKMLSLVNDWDTIDELQAVFFGAVPLSHPLWKLFTAHKDELWEALPPAN